MSRYSGWIIAGVVCLIIITLAVTGVLSFGNTPPSTGGTSSQALVRAVHDVTNVCALPLK